MVEEEVEDLAHVRVTILHLQGEHAGTSGFNMLHLPQIMARWIKADLTAPQTDPGDPAITAADPATPAAEHAHRAGGASMGQLANSPPPHPASCSSSANS